VGGLAEADQTAETLEETKGKTFFATSGMVLRSGGSEAWVVVSDYDHPIHRSYPRSDDSDAFDAA
jgi:hypothetical protein